MRTPKRALAARLFAGAAVIAMGLYGPEVSAAGIDLTMTALSGAPATARTGTSISLTNTVRTTDAVSRSFSVAFYLFVNASVGTAVRVGTRTISSLAANGSSQATTVMTIPTGTAPGVYYLGAFADSANVIAETNEANNTIVAAGTIQIVGPDLYMTSLTGVPARALTGASFSITSRVAAASAGGNAGAFRVTFLLSTDAVITASDTAVGSRSISALSSGATSSGTTALAVPTALAPGAYYVGAIVDSAGQVPESNESNNTFTGGVVTIARPNPCAGAPVGTPCKSVNDGRPCTDSCDIDENCVAGVAGRGACPFPSPCGAVCDGVSPYCQPAE